MTAVTEVLLSLAFVGVFLLGIEAVRWKFRPEERRRRLIKKIGGRR